MYKIERTSFGAKITLTGHIDDTEMTKWLNESKTFLKTAPSSFGVMIDMRGIKPLSESSQKIIGEGQKLYKEKGMQRSAVILDKTVTKMHFMRIAKETGLYQWERYIDASKTSNSEEIAKKWIINQIDPDK